MGTFAITPCDHRPMKGWYDTTRLDRRLRVGGYDIEERQRREYLRAVARALLEGSHATVVADDLSLAIRFREQADKWARETEHLSSPTQMMMHPSYHAVLGMAHESGVEVIRLMLQDLRDRRTPWFWALSYLTKDNPIKPSEAGKLDKMIKAWVDWGRAKGLL